MCVSQAIRDSGCTKAPYAGIHRKKWTSEHHWIDFLHLMHLFAVLQALKFLRLKSPLQVIAEIDGALNKWKESGRWEEKGILEQVANKEYNWTP
jgi:hypothetical protein